MENILSNKGDVIFLVLQILIVKEIRNSESLHILANTHKATTLSFKMLNDFHLSGHVQMQMLACDWEQLSVAHHSNACLEYFDKSRSKKTQEQAFRTPPTIASLPERLPLAYRST